AHDRGALASSTVGVIRSIETIKSSGLEQDAFSRWAGYHGKAMVAAQELDSQTVYLGVVPPLLAALGNAAVLGVGAFRVMRGVMAIGELVAFQPLMASFAEPIGRIVALGANLQQIKADLARVADVMAYAAAPQTSEADAAAHVATGALARLTGAIELRNVT